VDCLGFGHRGGEERGLGLCGGEERAGSATASAIPGPFRGEEKQGDGVSVVEKVNATAVERWGGRISMGSAAAVEKKLTTAINLGFGSRGGEEADDDD
jgi:hypothetical protein